MIIAIVGGGTVLSVCVVRYVVDTENGHADIGYCWSELERFRGRGVTYS